MAFQFSSADTWICHAYSINLLRERVWKGRDQNGKVISSYESLNQAACILECSVIETRSQHDCGQETLE